MASLFVHLPFEKNLLNVPLCPLENRGFFLFPLRDLNTSRFRFESFVRLHFNLTFPVNSLVPCSRFPRNGAGRSQDPRGREAVPTVILSWGRRGRLGARVGWRRGEAAVPWVCVWFSFDEAGKWPGCPQPFLSSGACSVGAGHHSYSREPVNQRRGGGERKPVLCFRNSVFFSNI